MARIANKIPVLVNNVVLRTQSSNLKRQFQPILAAGLKSQKSTVESSTLSSCVTRYPLNQQDANTYISNLKASAGNKPLDIVRTFNVLLPKRIGNTTSCIGNVTSMTASGQRCYSKKPKKCPSRDDKKKKKCKLGDDRCKKFKLKNCKAVDNFLCHRRPFVFKECKKMPAPYPSFSEACYEHHVPDVNECRDCPWEITKHPTYKPPKDKFGPPGRKFHTDARQFRFVKPQEEKQKPVDEDQQKVYEALNTTIFEKKVALKRLNLNKSNRILSVPPRTILNDMHHELYYLKEASQKVAPVDAKRIEMLLLAKKATGPRHKVGGKKLQKRNRRKGFTDECGNISGCDKLPFKPTFYDIKGKKAKIDKEKAESDKYGKNTCTCDGIKQAPAIVCPDSNHQGPLGYLCKMIPKKPTSDMDLECEQLAPSPVCPKNLLDRKPYPKYRKAAKKRLKKEKELEKQRRAARAQKKNKPKKCSDIGDGWIEAPWIEEPIANNNVIMCRDRVKVLYPPRCIKNDCDSGIYEKKKCPKKTKRLICPKDLLDRKPYKKFRKGKEKREKARRKKKGKGKKKCSPLDPKEMALILDEFPSAPVSPPRATTRL